jgi:hypothetical protein
MTGDLFWSQKGALSKESALTEGGEKVAIMVFSGYLGRVAVGEYSGKRYRFVREGVLRPVTRVLTADLGEEVATIRLKWRYSEKADIDLANGQVLRLFSHGIASRTWILKDEQGREICALVEKWGLLRSTGTFRTNDVIKGDPEVLFLALLIWYIVMIVSYQESAAGAGAGGG